MSIKKYNKLTNQEKLALVRFYPEEAKKDEHYIIRQEAYRILGYTKEAFKDREESIRLKAKIYLDFIKLNKKI